MHLLLTSAIISIGAVAAIVGVLIAATTVVIICYRKHKRRKGTSIRSPIQLAMSVSCIFFPFSRLFRRN